MDLIVFEKEAYYLMIKEVTLIVRRELKNQSSEENRKKAQENDWLGTSEAKILLGVRSKGKMQKLRDNGDIVFSRHGRKILYSKKSILDFLNENIKTL
jgi:hypothetical protein